MLVSWPLRIAFLGVVMVTGSLLFYRAVLSVSLIKGVLESGELVEVSYVTLVLVLTGLGLASAGITSFLRRSGTHSTQQNRGSAMGILSAVLRDRLYSRIFLVSTLIYGISFGIASGTFVYRPGADFSSTYGVAVPSVLTIVCCGQFGEMPQFVIYLTQNLGILLVPINLILLFTLSWLTGLNAGIAAFAYRNRIKSTGSQWSSGLGAILGLFTACPTCAGLFFMTILGLTGALAMTLASLQGFFVVFGVPLLAITPILSLRRIMSRCLDTCA